MQKMLHLRGEGKVILPELVELRLKRALRAQCLNAASVKCVVLLGNTAQPRDHRFNVHRPPTQGNGPCP
jgi:hypothetical protein